MDIKDIPKVFSEPYREKAQQVVSETSTPEEVQEILSARGRFILGLLVENGLTMGVNNLATTVVALAHVAGATSIHTALRPDHIQDSVEVARKKAAEQVQFLNQILSMPRGQA